MQKKEIQKKLLFQFLEKVPSNVGILNHTYDICEDVADNKKFHKIISKYLKVNPYDYQALKLFLLNSLSLNQLERCYEFVSSLIQETGCENTAALAILSHIESRNSKIKNSLNLFNLKRDIQFHDLGNAVSKEDLNKIIQNINTNFQANKDPHDQSVSNGEVRYLDTTKITKFNLLIDEISKHVQNFIISINKSNSYLKIPKIEDLKSGYWTVVISKNGKMLPHFHPRGIISGIFYFKIDRSLGGELIMGCSPSGIEDNINIAKIKVSPSNLIIFPSYYFHKTTQYKSNNERICLSFDYMTKNQTKRHYRS